MIHVTPHASALPEKSFLQSARSPLALHARGSSAKQGVLREGAKLGLIVAIATWLWLVLVDAVSGDPFRVITTLGGIVAFSVGHGILNVVYGVSLVSCVHGAVREPSLVMAALFGYVMVEIGFIMFTAALSSFLGGIAWLSILGGSLVGAAIAFLLLLQAHPLKTLLHRAETEP